jgi:hypothetical protein
MKALILIAAALLTGCYYDMRADAWAMAEGLCADHDGVVAADETSLAFGGDSLVEARCADETKVKKVLRRKK